MPYIVPMHRFLLQEEITPLAECLAAMDKSQRPGAMNYALSRLIKEVYGEDLKYSQYNEIIGMLESCKLEFYRAQVGPYEDKKRWENGRV